MSELYEETQNDERRMQNEEGDPAGLFVLRSSFIVLRFFFGSLVVFAGIIGCTSPAERDERVVVGERMRLSSLADPRTLSDATRGPGEMAPGDRGRWTGEATTRPAGFGERSRAATQPALDLTIEQAVLMALERNRGLIVQRYNPRISQYAEDASLAVFDPQLTATASASRSGLVIAPAVPDDKSLNAEVGVQQFFATGTTASVDLTAADVGTQLYGDGRDATASLRGGVSITQSLLQGAGLRVNLASVRQAQLDVLTSQYELRGFAEQLASDTEQAYIDFVLNERVLEIAKSALTVAQQQLDETDAMIASGKSAASDRAAAVATVAQRKEDLINARSTLEQTRLTFLRLVNPSMGNVASAWDFAPRLTQPPVPVGRLDGVNAHVRVALVYRSDLNQARLQVERGDLDVVKTRNGLLPRLDLFATLGRTWYSHFPTATGFHDAASYDATVGVNFDYPLLNRAARAAYGSSLATRDQANEAVANLAQQVEFDVRSAYEEALRAEEQIAATAATRAARDAALQVEQERYRVGKSTSLLVSLAQQDMLNSQIAQATAVASYLKGLVDLYRLEGSLLERRGVVTMDYPPKGS
jgi:outer membrane protein